ncbi:hypothetical protein NDU88_006755 [Pleurodeles waltl]|uniref:Uncharacterized protein n=1 Tax=Pleurodeles waltl TaxID=8319 RepID=A0AAV7VQK9_PLEWA|nr:hypothetical protein NDU88_006755 [Pleurodeles waltl]
MELVEGTMRVKRLESYTEEELRYLCPRITKEVGKIHQKFANLADKHDIEIEQTKHLKRSYRDKSEELQKGAEESISTDIAGEPSSAEVFPEADGAGKQTGQVPEQEGERVEMDQSQGDPSPPEPVAGPSREHHGEREGEESNPEKNINRRIEKRRSLA